MDVGSMVMIPVFALWRFVPAENAICTAIQ